MLGAKMTDFGEVEDALSNGYNKKGNNIMCKLWYVKMGTVTSI